jgi:N-acetylglucosamine kinase-like BadF-type ATPase
VGVVVGVDGGNTKTVAAVVRTDGRVLGVGTGACSDIYGSGSPAAGCAVLETTVSDALRCAGVGPDRVVASAFSLAGADWPEDIDLLTIEIADRLSLAEPLVVNDAIGALRSGSTDWIGIAVICGTFNAIGARNGDGRVFHLGFWPDRTGAFDLSTAALKAVYRDGLGLGPATALTDRALDMFGACDPLELLHSFTRRNGRRAADVVRLSPVLFDVAESGDAVARAIVAEAGRVLGDQARTSAARVDLPLDGTKVVLGGGVFNHPSRLLVDAVMERLPCAVPMRTGIPPIVGAILLALDRAGATVEAELIAAQLPPERISTGVAGHPD